VAEAGWSRHGAGSPPVLLIADDEEMFRLLAREALEPNGFVVEEAADGMAALAAFPRVHPDVVLLDVNMPGADGFTVCATLRQTAVGAHVPILIMTAADDVDAIHRAYEAGATDFITKPVNWVLLSYRLRYTLRASHAVEQLVLSEKRLSHAQQIAHLGSWDLELASQTLYWSDEVYRIHGASPEDTTSAVKTFWQAVHPDDRARVSEAVQSAMEGRTPCRAQYRVVRPDGQVRVVDLQGEVLVDTAGRPERLVGTVQDLTERTVAEEALRRSEERFAKAFRASPDELSIITLPGRYVDVNDTFLRVSGYTRAEVVGRTVVEVERGVDPDDHRIVTEQLRLTGTLRDRETTVRARTGEARQVLVSAELIDLGEEPCVLWIGRDITEGKRMESQLRQAHKMEAVGRLAGGVAHDFSNLLTVISGRAAILSKRLAGDAAARREVDLICEAAEQAGEVTAQLLAFSRKQVLRRAPVNLGAIVAKMSDLIRRLIGETIECSIEPDTGVGLVQADRGQVEQIILNLTVNARDAMPTGGRLTIRTADVELGPELGEAPGGAVPGSYVLLEVSDTGCGMDEGLRARVFEPFFTTKDSDKGTGLGLATVYGIVKQHDGYITVTSEPGRGSTFLVYLQRIEGVEESAATGEPGPLTARDAATGRLAEDGEAGHTPTREILERAGSPAL
jgi:two-component system cell cycle sensor histidine kinase/response regulator CckA